MSFPDVYACTMDRYLAKIPFFNLTDVKASITALDIIHKYFIPNPSNPLIYYSNTMDPEFQKSFENLGKELAVLEMSPETKQYVMDSAVDLALANKKFSFKNYQTVVNKIVLKSIELKELVEDIESIKNPKDAIQVVEKWKSILGLIPAPFKTKRVCLLAIYKYPPEMPSIPENLQTESFYTRIVTACGRALQFVPEPFRTEKVCRAALDQYAFAHEYVPPAILVKLLGMD